MVLIAVLAIAMTTAWSIYFSAERAHEEQLERTDRVVATLADAAFPLTDAVLRRMQGLSGAEFLVLGEDNKVEASSRPWSDAELPALRALPIFATPASATRFESALLPVAGRSYVARRVPVTSRFVAAASSLIVLYPEDRRWLGARQAAYPALIAGGAAAGLAVLLSAALARRFVRPIRQLRSGAARIAEGSFAPLALPPRNDELRDLAAAVNGMAEKLSQYERDVRANERLRTLGQLGAAVAHQLRNSATGARMAIELHRRQCGAGADHEALEVALRQLRLMESYLQRFLRLGRDCPLEFRRVDLATLVEESLELVRPGCAHGRIALRFEKGAGDYPVWGDADSLRDMLMNVTLNAIDAARRPGGGEGRVEIRLERTADARAALRVRDSGAGPGADMAERLFEPFVSEKPEGAGLGLFVARQAAEAHHGSIEWQRTDGMTCFTIELPLMSASGEHGPSADC